MDRDRLQPESSSSDHSAPATSAHPNRSQEARASGQLDALGGQGALPDAPEEILTLNPAGTEPHQHQRRPPGAASSDAEQQRLSTLESPLPPIPQKRGPQGDEILEYIDPRRRALGVHRGSPGPQSDIDWIVPRSEQEKEPRQKTAGERLDPTLLSAISEKEKYATKARLTGYSLNVAIGLQVLLGSLTTGLSVVTSGRQAQIVTTILGGLATVVASYLARARGSHEPELSIARVKDLEQFVRECEAFKMDHGHVTGNEYDTELRSFRERFEELLGNGNGERRLSQPV